MRVGFVWCSIVTHGGTDGHTVTGRIKGKVFGDASLVVIVREFMLGEAVYLIIAVLMVALEQTVCAGCCGSACHLAAYSFLASANELALTCFG